MSSDWAVMECIFLLLQKGWNIIHQVCCNGDLAILEWLLEKEPELNTCKLGQQSEVIRSV